MAIRRKILSSFSTSARSCLFFNKRPPINLPKASQRSWIALATGPGFFFFTNSTALSAPPGGMLVESKFFKSVSKSLESLSENSGVCLTEQWMINHFC